MSERTTKNRQKQKAQQQLVTVHEKLLRLMVLGLVMISIASLAWWQTVSWMNNKDTLPIKVVRIDGDLKKIKLKELEEAVADVVTGGYFNIDLQRIKVKATDLAWVDDVTVKRIWPDKLIIDIKERQAFARWGNDRLVTADGKIFAPDSGIDESLPFLQANDDRSVEVVNRFKQEQQRFAKLNLNVISMKLSERGAWSMTFAGETDILIGRHDVAERLQRLLSSLPLIKQYKGMPARIDLRYPHGMAVNWKVEDTEQKSSGDNQPQQIAVNEAV